MVFRITDRPVFLHPKEIVRIDPYEIALTAIKSKDYQTIKKILTGKGTARELSAFPTALLHTNPREYAELIVDAKKQEYPAELFESFCIARRLVNQFHNHIESGLEIALKQLGDCTKPVTRIAKFPYESFKRMYNIYKNEV